jgi:hypothetical protein
MSGILTSVQTEVNGILIADRRLAHVKILSEQLKDIRSEIQTTLGKLGLCAIISTPDAEFRYTNAPGPQMDPLKVSVDVVEFVLKNRSPQGTNQPASDTAERIAWTLHYPNHAHERHDVFPLTALRIRTVPDKNFLVYRVEFETSGALAGINAEEE